MKKITTIKTDLTFWIDVELMFNRRGMINRVNNCRRYREISESPVDLTLFPKSRTLPVIIGMFSDENTRILKLAGLV
jgi:hypothetical protein